AAARSLRSEGCCVRETRCSGDRFGRASASPRRGAAARPLSQECVLVDGEGAIGHARDRKARPRTLVAVAAELTSAVGIGEQSVEGVGKALRVAGIHEPTRTTLL